MDEGSPIHPGEILAEEFLIPHGLNANRLATRLGVPPNAITAIIKGTRGVSGCMSRLLGRAFGLSDGYFAALQTRYELDMAAVGASRCPKVAEPLRRAECLARDLGVAPPA
jgi:addiction module HigA family antidote